MRGRKMAKGYVPEAAPVQDFWSKVIEPGNEPIVFRVGRDITVLRSGVPRSAKDVKEGVCCVYFVKGAWHFLAMVSEKNLMKMEATLGTGRDRTPATNHAKTLSWGMEAAAKKTRMAKFRKVDACFGFWFDVDKKDGETAWVVTKGDCIYEARISRSHICCSSLACCMPYFHRTSSQHATVFRGK